MYDYLDDFVCGPTCEEYYCDDLDTYWGEDYDEYPNFNMLGYNE